MIFLIVAAVLLGLAGATQLTSATLGVGLIGVGCLFAILARITQAQNYQQRAIDESKREKAIA